MILELSSIQTKGEGNRKFLKSEIHKFENSDIVLFKLFKGVFTMESFWHSLESEECLCVHVSWKWKS